MITRAAITQEVFERVLARPATTLAGEHPSLIHLAWSAPALLDPTQPSRVVQVYVDGQLTAVSHSPAEREMWQVIDRSRPRRIELLAVPASPADERWRDHSNNLAPWPGLASAVGAAVRRDKRLPVDAMLSVGVDGTPGRPAPLFPDEEHRAGFGALFGIGAHGFDDATAPGLGRGELGAAPLGDDGRALRLRADADPGSHDLSLTAQRDTGGDASPAATATRVTEQLPPPPRELSINADFMLRWR